MNQLKLRRGGDLLLTNLINPSDYKIEKGGTL